MQSMEIYFLETNLQLHKPYVFITSYFYKEDLIFRAYDLPKLSNILKIRSESQLLWLWMPTIAMHWLKYDNKIN